MMCLTVLQFFFLICYYAYFTVTVQPAVIVIILWWLIKVANICLWAHPLSYTKIMICCSLTSIVYGYRKHLTLELVRRLMKPYNPNTNTPKNRGTYPGSKTWNQSPTQTKRQREQKSSCQVDKKEESRMKQDLSFLNMQLRLMLK